MANVPLIGNQVLLNMTIGTLSSTRRGEAGTRYQIFSASNTLGARIERITCNMANQWETTSSATQVRIYLTGANGSNPRLLREAAIPAASPSLTNFVIGGGWQFVFNGGLTLGTGSELWVGQQIAGANNNTHWIVEGSSFVSGGDPIYPAVPRMGVAQTTTASTRVSPTNPTLIFTAGPNGSRVEKIYFMAANLVSETPIANKMLMIWIKSGSDYINYRDLSTNGVVATTVIYGSNYVMQFTSGGLLLSANTELYAGISVWNATRDNVNWVVEAQDF